MKRTSVFLVGVLFSLQMSFAGFTAESPSMGKELLTSSVSIGEAYNPTDVSDKKTSEITESDVFSTENLNLGDIATETPEAGDIVTETPEAGDIVTEVPQVGDPILEEPGNDALAIEDFEGDGLKLENMEMFPLLDETGEIIDNEEKLQAALNDDSLSEISIAGNIELKNTLTVKRDVTINGNDYTLSLAPEMNGRHLLVQNTPSVLFSGLIIQGHGNRTLGGGVAANGKSTLVFEKTIIKDNATNNIYGGGGIFSDSGTVVLKNGTVIQNNHALDRSVMGYGGGVLALTLTVESGVTISGNSARKGGGVSGHEITSPTSNITIQKGAVIKENTAESEGGGVFSGRASVF